MATRLRPAQARDVPVCSRIMYDAFRNIAERHNFPPDIPSSAAAGERITTMLAAPGFDAFVAEDAGIVVGSIFVSRRSPVGGISVITVDPDTQDRGVGRRLMLHGMQFLSSHGHPRQQLVQAAYHNRSLSLYAKLGFVATEMLSTMTARPIRSGIPERTVRRARDADAAACNALCRRVHGFDREQEVAHAIAQGGAFVVERGGKLTGYTTGVGFAGHGVGETNDDLKALIASAEEVSGPGVLIPTRNGELFRWCLDNGLRVVHQMTLMDTLPSGPANGAYWPSILC